MENSSSKAEVMNKPVLLKACIPLALSLAGYIYARIIARRSINHEASSLETTLTSDPQETDSQEEFRDDHEGEITSSETHDYEEEISGLRTRIEQLQKREWELERRFVRFCELKEQESVLLELRNVLVLESVYVEFLDREISSIDAENQWVRNIVLEYIKVVEQLEHYKSQNGLLQKKVKKLMRRTKGQSKIITEKGLKIEAKEAEIKRNGEELQGRANVIRNLEDEVRKLKAFTDQLQQQKNELSQKLEMAENSLSSISKVEEEGLISIDDYNQLASEYEQVQKERSDAVKELMFLRWCNACLRYELKRCQLLKEYIEENKDHLEQDLEGDGDMLGSRTEQRLDGHPLMEQHQDQYEACLVDEAINGDQVCRKRQNLLRKFKKWVEGNEKMKSKLDGKEKQSVCDQVVGGNVVHTRKSCCSV